MEKYLFFYILFLIYIIQIYNVQSSKIKNNINLGCRDQNGNIVDWFYVYKLPLDHSQVGYDGLNYYYMISNEGGNQNWIKSNIKIDSKLSLVGHTISQIYNDDSLLAAIYNDEKLDDLESNKIPDVECGHTKGVLGANNETGFWLVHSVPKFPPPRNISQYKYPNTAKRYAQSFLCITVDIENLNMIGKQLIYNEPQFFTLDVPEILVNMLPNFKNLLNGVKITSPPYWNLETITTLGGTEFKVFAKTGKFGKELYADWVAPTLETNLLVETWLNGPGKLNSDCLKKYHVLNIADVKIGAEEFTIHHDHSKWAVGKSPINWICVGDINREVNIYCNFLF